jgi:methionine sulfoxide reductase heme-binding subunit
VAGLALLHFFWMRAAKNDFAEVAVYAAVIGVLLGWRVWRAWAARRAARGGFVSA